MLRFVQGINKALRSNQARAPCQKAAHDQDEFETVTGDCGPQQQRRSYTGLAVTPALSTPLSIPLSTENEQTEPNSQSTHNAFLLPGAIFGAGYAVFNSVHAFCSGRGNTKRTDRSRYCPAVQYGEIHRSSNVLRSLANLLPGRTYDITPSFSVLPNTVSASISAAAASALSIQDSSATIDDDDQVLCQKEYEKAQDEVNALADRLGNIDKDNLAADHFLALKAWNSKDFVSAAGIWQRTVNKFATPVAAHRLGVIYENGHGVPRDYQQASTYYKLAISHQCSKAMYKQAMLQLSGLVQAQTDSMELIKQSADLNYPKAQTYLGNVYFHKGNRELAVKYFDKAALQNDLEACFYLGICHETGAGVKSADDHKAAHYYTIAAEGGHSDAQFNLAMFYEEGCGGLDVNEEKCVHWLKKSSKQGNRRAREKLIELGCWNLSPSASLPTIDRHLPSSLSDLAVHEMTRAYSDNFLPKRHGLVAIGATNNPRTDTSISAASSSSSVAGTPQFYIPSGGDEDDDVSSFGEWSDEGLSSASSSSLHVDHPDDKFSIDFTLTNTSYKAPTLYRFPDSCVSLSSSSLLGPDHDGPQIIFT